MSLLNWLFAKKSPAASIADAIDTQPLASAAPTAAPTDPLAQLKQQRHENRENLYELVRGVMLRCEVLSSHYKFKVLSLDARGRQFLVMIDLLNDTALPPQRWAAVEQLMTTTALHHHDLQVKAVYWRMMMASTEPAVPPPVADTSVAGVAEADASANAPIAPGLRGYEPIHQDEVLAFKKALEEISPPDAAPAVHPEAHRPQGPSAQRHGFEDTQLLEPDPNNSPLSKTQFGGLD